MTVSGRVATVLLAGVVVGVVFTSDSAASPRHRPSPIRAVSVAPPPPGEPVYWWAGSDLVTQIRAIAWEGKQVGSMTFNKGVSLFDQAPDGSRLMVSDPTGLTVLTSEGRVLDFLTAYQGMWADDSKHLCAVSTLDGGPGIVWQQVSPIERIGFPQSAWTFLALPGGASAPGAQVGTFSPHGRILPVACSPASNRLVVATSFVTQVVSVAVYRLSDGQRLRQWQPGSVTGGAGAITQNVVASHDGRWLAENAQIGSQIREVSTGTILATVPRGHVLAFSWDGSRILVFNGRISLRDWRQDRDLWTACEFELVAVRPAAADFMVGLHGRGPRELRVVHAEGSVTPVAGDTLPANAYEVTPLFGC